MNLIQGLAWQQDLFQIRTLINIQI
jgi:hypothetical protein